MPAFHIACTSWNSECRVPIPTYALDLDHPFGPTDVGNQRFPLVCCIEIIEHVENPAAFLRSCESLLDDNGRIVLSTPNVESAAARLQWLVRGTPLSFSGDEVRQNRHISMLWREGLEFLIEQAGLRVCEKHLVVAFCSRRHGWRRCDGSCTRPSAACSRGSRAARRASMSWRDRRPARVAAGRTRSGRSSRDQPHDRRTEGVRDGQRQALPNERPPGKARSCGDGVASRAPATC